MKVRDRLVLVTGASSGLGAEIARAAARRGARLVLVARDQSRLDSVASSLREMGAEVVVRSTDLSRVEEIEGLGRDLIERIGVPDVLVNNAGSGHFRAVDENAPGEALQQMAVPFLAAFELTRILVPRMIARGSGHIANMTSASAFIAHPGANGYGSTRWAMRGFTGNLRADLRGTGIHVTLICPGLVDTPYAATHPGSEARIPRSVVLIGVMSAESVGKKVVRAIERERRNAFMPWRLIPALWLAQHFPRLNQFVIDRTGWKRQLTGGTAASPQLGAGRDGEVK